jgi:hypothetical protein
MPRGKEHQPWKMRGRRYYINLIDGFVPPSTSVAPMFPFFEDTAELDDLGEVVNPDDYMMKQ